VKDRKEKIDFLDLVIPLVCVYMAFLCGYTYFSNHDLDASFKSVAILFSCSFFFSYGLFSFFRDLKLFGIVWMLKSFRKFFKK